MTHQYVTATGEKIPPYLKGPWWFTKIVPEADIIPAGYGFCFCDLFEFSGVYAPIPLNLVYGWWHRFQIWLRMGVSPGKYQREIQLAYERGRDETRLKFRQDYYDYQQLRKAYHRGEEHALARMWVEAYAELQQRGGNVRE